MRSLLPLLTLLCAATLLAEVPRPAGELTWKGHDGKSGSLAQQKGKTVVLLIMSTTCPHCQETAGILTQLAPEFAQKGVQFQGVAINDDADTAAFIRQFHVNFPVGKGGRDQALAFLQQSVMRSFYFPGLIFVDRNGVVQAQYSGADTFTQSHQLENIRQQLDKMVGAGAPSKNSAAPKPARKAS